MSEVSGDHELKSFSGTGRVPSDHWVLGHDLSDSSDSGIEGLGSDLISATKNLHWNRHTLKARSFAVKIPLNPSSSSTTKTQSVLLAAQS